MPVLWPQFITNVKNLLTTEMLSFNGDVKEAAAEFGKRLSEEYDSAISKAQSPTGQLWGGNGIMDPFTTAYEDAFVLLVEEGEQEKNKIEDDLDEDGNKIPGTGKESNPDFADPDQNMPPPPIIDPEKLRNFVAGPSGAGTYKQTHSLHSFNYFEFHIEELDKDNKVLNEGLRQGDDIDKVGKIIATRLLFQFQSLSYSKREKFLEWLESFEDEPGDLSSGTVKTYYEKVEETLEGAGFTGRNSNGRLKIIMNVKYFVKGAISNAYGYKQNSNEIDVEQNGIQVEYPFSGRPLSFLIAAEESHVDRPQIPNFVNSHFITFFTFKGDDKAWDFTKNKIETKYEKELEDNYYDCPEVEEESDVLTGSGGTLFSMTKQDLIDEKGNANDEESSSPDPYEELGKATIEYWKSALAQPLKANPPVPPCLVSLPLNGIYIPVSYGSAKLLGNDIRKALNAGKMIEDNADLSAQLVASALAVAYAKHLLMIKFIYAGGITTPVGPVPMIGMVPAVF